VLLAAGTLACSLAATLALVVLAGDPCRAASGRPRNWDARSMRRSSPRSAAAPQAGRGS